MKGEGDKKAGGEKPERGIFVTLAGLLVSSRPLNHYLIHPDKASSHVSVWNEERKRGNLLMRLVWARPSGAGPFPAVLVHPEAGKTAFAMRGVVMDLAEHGYAAAAVSYRRLIDGVPRTTLFPFKEEHDLLFAYEAVTQREDVDRRRIGLLGFSQGGVFSLLIAAAVGSGAAAAVAYYPVVDFDAWSDVRGSRNLVERAVRTRIRSYFRAQSGAKTEEDFLFVLRRASPLVQAASITAPVLLIHGDRDATAPVEQSILMHERLLSLGRTTEIVIVPGAVHAFNFRHRGQAAFAWRKTLDWFGEHLAP